MTRVVGFEGILTDDDVISYGAAAIERDGVIVNSITRIEQPREELDENVEAVTFFQKSWEVAHSVDDAELIVVAIRVKDDPWCLELVPASGFGGFLGKKRAKPYVYLLFRDRIAFKQYANETASRVADAILREQWEGVGAYLLIQSALVLAPRDPMLLALRVYLASDKSAARRTADRLLTNDIARSRFTSYLKACEQPSDAMYLLKYEDGDQKIGGFNINTAVEQLDAISRVTTKLRPELRETIPFLVEDDDQLPELRFQRLKAASAELGFGVLGRNLRERVLRYLELEMLARVFRGDVPPSLAKDPLFVTEVRKILAPAGGAVLRHQPIGAPDLEPVSVDLTIESERILAQTTVCVLGFVQGFYREVRRAEVRFANDYAVSVPIEDDGYGNLPVGTEPLRLGEGLFRPAVFAMLRSVYSTNRVKWHVQRMSFLKEEQASSIDTLPSSILPRALFGPGDTIEVAILAKTLRVGSIQFSFFDGGIDDAKEWLRRWSGQAHELELHNADKTESEWYAPPSVPEPNALQRIIVAVAATGAAQIDQIVRRIDEIFDTHVRTNNTWRTIHANADLFTITTQNDEDIVDLSPRGRSWNAALQRYLGERAP
jgi:hypothetical protein